MSDEQFDALAWAKRAAEALRACHNWMQGEFSDSDFDRDGKLSEADAAAFSAAYDADKAIAAIALMRGPVGDGLYAWVRQHPREWERITESDLSQPLDAAKMRAEGWFPVYTHPQDASRDAEIARLRRCVGFFASVIKSGEPWTSHCQVEYETAMQAKEPAE